jgi:hypothetical protein
VQSFIRTERARERESARERERETYIKQVFGSRGEGAEFYKIN